MNKNKIIRDFGIVMLIFIISLSIISIMNPGMTGWSVKRPNDGKVQQEVLDQLKDNDEVNVIIVLKETEGERISIREMSKKSALESKKITIRNTQDNVLSSIKYENFTKEKITKKRRSGITGWFVSNVFEEKPEFKLKNKYSTVNFLSGKISKKGLKKLRKNPNVKKIVPVINRTIFLTESMPLINGTSVHSMQVSGINLTGAGQTVCILDTGIDYNHSDLGGGWGNKVIGGYDFVNNDNDPMDDHGHGTHVAGIVAANGTLTGVAPYAQLIGIKVCDSVGNCATDNIIAGIDWCTNNASKYNISVITMSIGGRNYSGYCDNDPTINTTEVQVINNAVGQGIFVDAASGNDGLSGRIAAPACIKNATSVGATDKTDMIANYSNSGTTLDLLAPGGVIISPIISLKQGGGTIGSYGTSMAAPHVAGAAAILYQYEKLLNNRNATPSEVRELLKRTGKPILDSRNGLTFPRVNILAAIDDILKINETDNSIKDLQGNAKVRFNTNTDLTRASEAFIIGHNLISLNASKYSEFNKSANLTLYNLSFLEIPVILKKGVVCTPPSCNTNSYDGNLGFTVSSFSNYTAATNSQLYIFDDVDNGTTKYTHENITFYANYTNRTSGVPISTGSCNISFSDSEIGNMSYSGGLFKYTREFLIANLYTFNISCNETDYETLTTTDDITVLPGCGLPLPNVAWNISGNNTVICNNENLVFQNQTLKLYQNATLIWNNTNIIMNSTVVLDMNISSYSTLIIENSNLNSIDQPFNIYCTDYSRIILENSSLAKTLGVIYIQKNCSMDILESILRQQNGIHFIDNSNSSIRDTLLNISIWVEGSANVYIENSNSTGITNLYTNANVTLKNSTFNTFWSGWPPAGQARVNFINPRSTVTSEFIFQPPSTSIVLGYVDLPTASRFFGSPTVIRYYPVHINYTNGSPAINKLVNISNASATLWSGLTDSQGFANPNITWTTNTTKYNISVNPSQSIALLTDTPIIFQLDGDPPVITLRNPQNNSWNLNGNVTFTFNITDTTGIENASIYLNSILNQTNASVTQIQNSFYITNIPDGTHTWYIEGYDNSTDNNRAVSETWIINIDTTPPDLDVQGPANNTINDTGTIDFIFNATDLMTTLANATLIINGQPDTTILNPTETTIINITTTLANGQYNWSIEVYDNNGFSTTSPTYNLTINQSTYCGDGIVQKPNGVGFNEDCDGSNLNGQSCQSLGWDSGTLTCLISCEFKTAGCENDGGSDGGGSTSPIICDSEWECEDWGTCVNGNQTRTCTDINNCLVPKNKPETEQECSSLVIPEQEPTCSDNIKNQGEEEIDCGGPCPPCKESTEEDNQPEEPKQIQQPIEIANATAEETQKESSILNKGIIFIKGYKHLFIPLLLILLLVLILLYYGIIPLADEETIDRLFKEKKIKKFKKLYILFETYFFIDKKYRNYIEEQSIHTIRPIDLKPTKHNIQLVDKIKERYNLPLELCILIAIGRKRIKATIYTQSPIPKEVKKRFRNIQFVDPFKEEQKKKKHLPHNRSELVENQIIKTYNLIEQNKLKQAVDEYKKLRKMYTKSRNWLYHEDLKELYADLKYHIVKLPKKEFTKMMRYLRKRG